MSSPQRGEPYERITYSGVNKPKPLLSFVREYSGGAEWRFFVGNENRQRKAQLTPHQTIHLQRNDHT